MITSSCCRILGASVTGASHEAAGLSCQDALRWHLFPGDVLVVAVADGAGSARLGDIGAQVATNAAISHIGRQRLDALHPHTGRALLNDTLAAARAALVNEADTRRCGLDDLATTLLIAVTAPGFFAAAQIGDGAIVVGNRRMGLTVITTPHTVEYLNETLFLTAPHALGSASITVVRKNFAYLTMLTDGLQLLSLRYPDGTPYPPFFHPLFTFISHMENADEAQAHLSAFLASPQIRERTDDDVTLVVARLEY